MKNYNTPESSTGVTSPAVVCSTWLGSDEIISVLERHFIGWSLDHTGNMIEARVWIWPMVIGRYRPNKVEPLADMLRAAIRDALDVSTEYMTDAFISDARLMSALPNPQDQPCARTGPRQDL